MRYLLMLLLGVTLLVPTLGCGGVGGMSQEDMKRRAMRRKKDDEPPPATAVAAAEPPTPDASAAAGAASDAPGSAQPGSAQSGGAAPADTPTPEVRPPSKESTAAAAVAEGAGEATAVAPIAPPAEPLGIVERRARTIANLEQIAAALEKYLEAKGAYPAASIHFDKRPLLSWRVELLPYLGYEELYKQFHLNEPWDSPHNRKLLSLVPEPYQSPERFDEKTNYLAVVGGAFAFDRTRGRMPSQFEDGVINSALVLEVDDTHAVAWTAPQDFEPAPNDLLRGLGQLREDGFFMIWGGGTVGRIAPDVGPRQAYAMFSIEGGESFLYSDLHQPALAAVAVPEAEEPSADPESVTASDSAAPSADGSQAANAIAGSGAAGRKWSPPDDAAAQEALKRLREIYEPQFTRARQRAERVAVAQEMLTQAERLTDDPTTCFVLLHLVTKIAAEAGNLAVVEKALTRLEDEFAFDAFPLRTESLQTLAKQESDNPAELITAALDAATRAMKRDDYDVARSMHGIAASHVREIQDRDQTRRVAQVKRTLETGQRDYKEVVRALERLEQDPENAEANTAVGKYYCLVKNDWRRGIPFLVKAGDKLLAAAAGAEAQGPSLPDEYVAAGDAWWSYGEANRHDRRAAYLRAVHWYLRTLDHGNSTLAGIKAEIRIKQVEQEFGSEAVATLRSELGR